jgi:hypothetical protein
VVSSRLIRSAKALRLRTLWGLYPCHTLLKRLAQYLQHVAPELRQLIRKQNTMVRQRDLARQRQLPLTDQPHGRDRVVRSAKRAGDDEGGAVRGEIGDAAGPVTLSSFRRYRFHLKFFAFRSLTPAGVALPMFC